MVQQKIVTPNFPNTDALLFAELSKRPAGALDILVVNPPAPDGGVWIRSQHRVGRRSREGMIWPQVDLAQIAALFPDFRVEVVDAIAERMSWAEFEQVLDEKRPRYYITQVTAPTLQNDMSGTFLAKARGAVTVAFGTHVTPMPASTLEPYPSLDYVFLGEPELTFRELVDVLEAHREDAGGPSPGATEASAWWPGVDAEFSGRLKRLFTHTDPGWTPVWRTQQSLSAQLAAIKGLVWRNDGDVVINPPRPYIADLNDLPRPRHDLLPLTAYRAPLVGGPYAFIVPSRGCPANCRFCIKHVSYGASVRYRDPEDVVDEIETLVNLGVHKIHMYADLFTVNREQVVGICEGILARKLPVKWTCNSRVDFVDLELLHLMRRAGCWMISWGIESGDEAMLKRMRKGITPAKVERALGWAKEAGIMNWGYFIIGLPGETEASIRKTIDFAKRLPLDLVLFHIAAPHPGTPFFFEVVENNWFRPGTRWEDVDMDRSTVLDYPNLKAEDLERWAARAFREWAFRPGPILTYLKLLLTDVGLIKSAVRIGLETLGWK